LPSGQTYYTPRSIPADCSADVTASLTSWIDSVPDNSTLEFPAGACYDVEGTLLLQQRSGLLLQGNGAEILAKTEGSSAAPPSPTYPSRGFFSNSWPSRRSQFWVEEGKNITFDDFVIHGAANLFAPHEGAESGTDQSQGLIGQYGIAFAGVNGAMVENSTITDTFSDAIGMIADNPANTVFPFPSTNVTIVRNVIEHSDRNGPSVYDGSNIIVEDNSIGDTWGPIVDFEPVATRWLVNDATVLGNTIGSHAHYLFAADGASATDNNLAFLNNVDHGGNLTITVGSHASPPPIRQNVSIVGNSADVKGPTTSLISIRGIDGVTVESNSAPTGGTAISVDSYTSNLVVSNNSFPGATSLLG
jgi:hypothetical protein